ncbi:MAG: translocase, partial [Deltaproteobacteria bacterium]|nr:translocase [Deltaproteobacteria bacterium]
AQFWSFANDVYTREEGERLFPLIAIGSATGAVTGAYAVKALARVVGKSIELWMLIAAAILFVCMGLTRWVDRRERHRRSASGFSPSPSPKDVPLPDPPINKDGAFKMVLTQRYLLLMALMSLALNWVNTSGEFILGSLARDAAIQVSGGDKAAEKAFIGQFYANFFLYVNIAGMAMQFFVVSRIIKWFGVRIALFGLPLVALGSYVTAAIIPKLSVVRWTKTAENALDYSLQNTASQALFLVTSREAKYKAKQAIDTLFVRLGDVMSAVLVGVLMEALKLNFRFFIYGVIALVVAWLLIVFFVGRDYAAKVS